MKNRRKMRAPSEILRHDFLRSLARALSRAYETVLHKFESAINDIAGTTTPVVLSVSILILHLVVSRSNRQRFAK